MSPNTDIHQDQVFIGGRWRPSNGGEIAQLRFPGSGEVVGVARHASVADVDQAVSEARATFDSGVWRRRSPKERSEVLLRAADLLDAQTDELARSMVTELGCTLEFARHHHVPSPLRNFRFYASYAAEYEYDDVYTDGVNQSLITQEPVGVVGAISPWNAPLGTPILKLAPALAAGCSVVVKPSPETPVTIHRVGEALAQAGLPAGVLSIVPGGREVGEHLVAHPEVDKIAFTGSTVAGRQIMASCAQRIARVTLELGGKSAAIVLPDADLNGFVTKIIPMAMMLSGQACNAQTRVLVPRPMLASIRDLLADAIGGLSVGDPFDPATDVGPLINERQRARVEEYLALASVEGVETVVGGGRPKHLSGGWYVSPTLLSGVDNRSRIAQEEIFGPVLSLIGYDDDVDAVRLANDSIYGLAGSVWTSDIDRAMTIAREIRTGMVSINGFSQPKGSPFGGYKQSGIGREMGPYGFENYLETKSIAIGPPTS